MFLQLVVLLDIVDLADAVLEDVVAVVGVAELFNLLNLLSLSIIRLFCHFTCGFLLLMLLLQYIILSPSDKGTHIPISMQLIPPLATNLFRIRLFFVTKGISYIRYETYS